MWLEIKQAASKAKTPPMLGLLQDQLGGTSNAILYRRLFEDHPEVERGPDEDLSSHFSRLQRAHQQWRDRDTTDVERRRSDPRAQVTEDPSAKPPAWTTLGDPEPDSEPSDLKGMPQRIPGWFTGDAMDAPPPPGYGTPPMSRRDPGATLRSPVSPSAGPKQQSMQEWIDWLGTKGIVVDDNGMRVDPAEPLPHRPLTGPQIWQPFVGPTTDESYDQYLRDLPEDQGGLGKSWRQKAKELIGRPGRRRAASAVVTGYVQDVFEDIQDASLFRVSGLSDDMNKLGWDYYESGSGNWYQKKIGDLVHVIVKQPGGWIHNSGLSADNMGENPMWFNDLGRAMMHAHRGQVQVGFTPPPPHQQSLSMVSWRNS